MNKYLRVSNSIAQTFYKSRNASVSLNTVRVFHNSNSTHYEQKFISNPNLCSKDPGLLGLRSMTHFHPSIQSNRKFHISHIKSYNFLKLFYHLQNVFKLDSLRIEWDPKFESTRFESAASQALCTTVNLIRISEWTQLHGLFTRELLRKLQEDQVFIEKIKRTKEMTEEKIDHLIIKLVNLQQIVQHKYCDVDIQFMIKEEEVDSVSYTMRLHRDYTEGKLPEWTITKFQYHI